MVTGPAPLEATPKVVETHISVIFFIYDKVYKLRKPVRFGFLDFTDRSRRRVDCDREVMLNRRLAPDVYLGVADVVIDGTPVDHMVVMRRMPDERRLSLLARRGDDIGDLLGQVARTMAAFHKDAKRSREISGAATVVSLRANWKLTLQKPTVSWDRFSTSVQKKRSGLWWPVGLRVVARCSNPGSHADMFATGMATCRQMTYSVSTTGSVSSTASNSPTGCAIAIPRPT